MHASPPILGEPFRGGSENPTGNPIGKLETSELETRHKLETSELETRADMFSSREVAFPVHDQLETLGFQVGFQFRH